MALVAGECYPADLYNPVAATELSDFSESK
jgi:hypothetical protein